jgi:hypothetical protein
VAWLAAHSLEMYTDPLVEAGYSRMLFLATITEAEIQEVAELCKMKRPHARVFRTALAQLCPETAHGTAALATPVVVHAEPVVQQPAAAAAATTRMAVQTGTTRTQPLLPPRAHSELLSHPGASNTCCERFENLLKPFNEWFSASSSRLWGLILGMTLWFFGVVTYMCMSNSAMCYIW